MRLHHAICRRPVPRGKRMTKLMERLRSDIVAIDGSGYGAYKRILGSFDFGDFDLHIDYVQGDPFASPSRLRAVVPASTTQLPADLIGSKLRRTATADFLNRQLAAQLELISLPRGNGVSGLVAVLRPGQQILERTSLQISDGGGLVARITAGLPARGRRVLAEQAAEMLLAAIPNALRRALSLKGPEIEAAHAHAELAEDSAALRDQLAERRLVAFIPNGAILPRRSGIDDHPSPRAALTPAPSATPTPMYLPDSFPFFCDSGDCSLAKRLPV